MTDHIIRVNGLKKNYGSTIAVDGIDFDIERGKLVSILGPNGAGKTTSLECLEGLLKPDGGRIEIDGKSNTTDKKHLSNQIGIQLQSSALPENLTVLEAMRLFCSYRRIPVRSDLLSRFGLNGKLNTRFSNLSTGQKRRLSLALAIIHNPQVLFLDEPTAGLDVQSRIELHGIIGELKQGGTTIILATHDMAEAESLSDKIIILLNGKIVAEGSPAEITATGDSVSRISVRTENRDISETLKLLPGIESFHLTDDFSVLFSRNIEETVSSVLELIKSSGDTLVDLRIERPTLEERFVEITDLNKQTTGVL